MKILLFCMLLLCGCTAKILPLPPQNAQPVQAQFGLRFASAGMAIPLQGAVQMAENGGNLGFIFPHGRTLGVCHYRDGGMECVPAGYDVMQTRFMLRQIGLAVYRILPTLTQESAEDTLDKDWIVSWHETNTGWRAEYLDLASQVTMDIHFTEISLQ